MPKHAKKSDHLQLVDSARTTMVEVPLPLLGAFAKIENSFFDLCIDAGQQVLGAMMEQDREDLCGPPGKGSLQGSARAPLLRRRPRTHAVVPICLAEGAVGEQSNASGVDGNEHDNSLGEGLFAAGAVYVFRRDDGDGSWSKEAYVKALNPGELDRFGFAVTLSGDGDILVVGADLENSGATGINGNQTDNSAEFAGAAYVFVRDPIDGWSQHSYLKAPNTDPADQFGYALDLSADATMLVVGAVAEDSNASGVNGDQNNESIVTSGAAYLY